jgi:hypothetical protein
MEEYWRTRSLPTACVRSSDLKAFHHHVLLHSGIGTPLVRYEGHAIDFHDQMLTDMGPNFATIAILHELVHVTFYASGEPNHWARAGSRVPYHAAELLVHERLLGWGVDQSEVLTWIKNYEQRNRLSNGDLL